MNEEKMTKRRRAKDRKPAVKENSSKKLPFNFLDVLIIISLLAAIVLVIYVYSPASLFRFNSNDTTVIYSVCVSGVPAEYATTIGVGDTVTDDGGYRLGVVVSDVEVEPHVIYEYREGSDGNGSIEEIIHPELVDLIITISADADVAEDGYTVDGKRIALEAEYDLVLPGFEAKGICISLSEENANDVGVGK